MWSLFSIKQRGRQLQMSKSDNPLIPTPLGVGTHSELTHYIPHVVSELKCLSIPT